MTIGTRQVAAAVLAVLVVSAGVAPVLATPTAVVDRTPSPPRAGRTAGAGDRFGRRFRRWSAG